MLEIFIKEYSLYRYSKLTISILVKFRRKLPIS